MIAARRRAGAVAALLILVASSAPFIGGTALADTLPHTDRPTRTVERVTEGFGPVEGVCAFAVSGRPDADARLTTITYPNGTVRVVAHASPTLTNVDTGVSLVHRSRFSGATVPLGDGLFSETTSGRFFIAVTAGELGPFGIVQEPGLFLSLQGTLEVIIDTEAGAITQVNFHGRSSDLCAALSPVT
jgi:hypothetical protein